MLVVVAASAHVLAAHAAAVAEVPLQFPSVPTYEAQVVVVPVYDEQAPNEFVQPYPVVTQTAKKLTHPAFVFVLAGASEQAKALQAVEPAVVFAVQGPSDPMRPVHPWV